MGGRVDTTRTQRMTSREDQLAQLLHRIGESDGDAMQELFLLERASLHRLFLGLSRCAALAEDLVQGTFLNLWRYRAGFSGRGSAAAYLHRVAINEWRRSLSKEGRKKDAWRDLVRDWRDEDDVAEGEASRGLESSETMSTIHRAIDALPPEQREVFLLHKERGLSCPQIAEATGAESRVTVLGHLQRGGMPTPRDRLMASIFGVHAVDLIAEGRFDRMVAWSGRQVTDVPLAEAVGSSRDVDVEGPLVHTARGLGICLGDP